MLRDFKMMARAPSPVVFIPLILVFSAISILVQVNRRKAFAYPHNFDVYHPEN